MHKNFYSCEKEETKLKQKILDIQEDLKKYENKLAKVKQAKIDEGLLTFDSKKRNEIIENAEKLCYSAILVNRMKEYLDPNIWNQDNINDEVIGLFSEAEKYIKEHKKPHGYVFKFFDLLGTVGINESEEGPSNDN